MHTHVCVCPCARLQVATRAGAGAGPRRPDVQKEEGPAAGGRKAGARGCLPQAVMEAARKRARCDSAADAAAAAASGAAAAAAVLRGQVGLRGRLASALMLGLVGRC